MEKYYELEKLSIRKSTKCVMNIYHNHGKIQIFPIVDSSKHGIGRGRTTLDLKSFSKDQLKEIQELINSAIEMQLSS